MGTKPSKYDALGSFLRNQPFPKPELWLSLTEIQDLVGKLPKEATTHQFWANTEHHPSRRYQWMKHGYDAYLRTNNGVQGVSFRPSVVIVSSSFDRIEDAPRDRSWSDAELRCCVTNYYRLLVAQQNGQKLSKSSLRTEALSGALIARSAGAYEFRMQNISAVLSQLGLDLVTGYLPRSNIGSVKERLIALINVVWGRQSQLESVTDDPLSLEARVFSARLKYREHGLLAAPPGSRDVKRVSAAGMRFARDPNVIAWVLNIAGGKCEVCENDAPFFREDGTPYLEVHHVRWLSQGGPDTDDNAIACCPTCHRRLHHSPERSQLRRSAIAKVARLVDHPIIPVSP